ncbi:MAG: carbonic anhydrase [Betaproteobacteria bacterium HGW-Betaproteobacteria-7]|jgi:carbonic anhydrase|nr:MAG: carbonic anhydrase [Betaproteobacteria bacterium HGW-Betaproteobacteria-7]
MHPSIVVALAIALPLTATAAPTWQNVSSEPGKRIELDRTSIKREGQTVEAQSRMILEKELIDIRSGAPYLIIEVVTRYDCTARNANTIKRTFKKDENTIVRAEDLKGTDLPVRSGTLDDKVLREVCRPPKESQADLAAKANEAANQLRQANEALLKKELAKAPKATPLKTSDAAPAAAEEAPKSAIPSIRPSLKAAAEANLPKPATNPAPVETRPVAQNTPAPVAKPPAVRRPPAAKPRPPAPQGGYMLELVRSEPTRPTLPVQWGYEGAGAPENWARLDPRNSLCASGQRQSPIDISDGIKVDVEPVRFDYRPSRFRIADTGRTVEVFLGDMSFSLTGKTYTLQKIAFHRPSEERIDGRRFDMSAHLIHKADDGQLAIIAVLIERGNENPFIQTLWNNLPLEKGLEVAPPAATIDLDALLPTSRNYYAYMGSLTTPPCTEGVLWLVMKQPIQVSQQQVDIFSRLYRNNARPVQPTNGRLIKEGR